jgi:Motility related/secretion protein
LVLLIPHKLDKGVEFLREDSRFENQKQVKFFTLWLVIITLLVAGSLAADTFPVKYYLSGLPRVENTEINLLKIPPGISMVRNQAIIFREMKTRTEVEIDQERELVYLVVSWGLINDLYPRVGMSYASYFEQNFRKVFRDELFENSKELLAEKERSSGQGLIKEFTFKLPAAARKSKIVRGILGNQAGSLSLDGSEKITIGGSSSTSNRTADESGSNRDFDLTMKQELNLRLRGKIGEKIHVNVNHQSSSDDSFTPSNDVVEISYEGTEDEVIKSIEGGNIALSLQGSQYISYSASSKGLFGIKSELELGNLHITTILGKDEAEKDQQTWNGSSKSDSSSIESKRYQLRRFFYITDPSNLFTLYGDPGDMEAAGVDYPVGWEGNAIRTNGGRWIMKAGADDLLPVGGTLHVYFDDGTSNNEGLTLAGLNIYDSDDDNVYSFTELIEGTDYTFDYDVGLLYINRTINKPHSIGVAYQLSDGTFVGHRTGEYNPIEVKILKISNQSLSEDEEYWRLAARNIYDFGEGKQPEDFELYVYDDLSADGTQTITCPSEYSTPLPSGTSYNEYLRLDTSGDGVINGEDETVSLASGYLIFPFLEPFRGLGDGVIYEKEPISVHSDDFHMHITVLGMESNDQISLDQMNILPGSVTITLGEGATERELKENVDFIVDHEFGIITFMIAEARDPDAILNIKYNYKSVFSIDSKTLAGIRADWDYSDNFNIGATFVYQDERMKEDHPKIGSENKTLILSAIDSRMEYELPYLTKFIDWLPLIATDEDSRLTISGEVAMSLPKIYGNPDNPEEAYIDDMEAILESFPMGVVRSGWSPASQPYDTNLAKAQPNWFNPQNIYRKDVYNPESLTSDEEDEEIQVLALKLQPPGIHTPGVNNRYWGGLMKYVGNQIDFSTKKFLEVLVKVDSLSQNPAPVVMHINIGDINEDFYTDFGGEGVLNTEDGKNGGVTDGQLDIYDDVDEDIGLDGIADGEPGDDPEDNYDGGRDDEGDYPEINGTENNKKLDTEDLDNNGELNDSDVYFEYSVTLKDTTFLENVYNGWYLYRIPVDDSDYYREVSNKSISPDLERISFARVWFEVEEEARIKIVNFDIIGNKWESHFIRDEYETIISQFDLENKREKMQVSIIDNQKSMHYTPAPGTVIKESGEETLEQSLYIDYTNLQSGHHGLVRQKFQAAYNLLNYNRIRFWVYSEKSENTTVDQPHDLIIRIGADSTNFYEVTYPLSGNDYQVEMDKDEWINLDLDFALLTYLKSPDLEDSSYVEVNDYLSYYYYDDIRIEMHKDPTLSNIKEVSLGLENNGNYAYSGRVYFDDIRVAEPYNEIGYAARGTLNLKMADFATVDVNTELKSDNFQNNAKRQTTVPNKEKIQTLNINGNVNLHKFFPAQWGVNMPLSLSRQESHKVARFMYRSDILWDYLNDEDKEREKSHFLKYKADLSMKLTKSPNTASKLWNGLVDKTVKATTLSGYIEKKFDVKPTTTDTILSYQVKHEYKLSIPKDKVGIGILKNYKIYLVPQSFNNTLTYKAELPNGRRWRWTTTGDSAHWQLTTNVINTKSLTTSSTLKYDILSDFSSDYSLKTTRDMLVEKYWEEYNIGTEKTRDQTINMSYSPKYLGNIFSYNSTLKIKYTDKTKKRTNTGEDDEYYYQGGVDRDFGTRLTLMNHDIMMSFVNWVWKDSPGGEMGNEPESGKPGVSEPGKDKFEDEMRDENEREGFKNPEDFDRPGESRHPAEDMQHPKIDLPMIEEDKKLAEIGGDELPKGDEKGEGTEEGEEEESKPRVNLLKAAVTYISGLENLSIDFDNSYSTDYDDRAERPSLEYQLGFPHILTEEDTEDSTGASIEKEITMRQDDNGISVSTGFPIWRNLTTTLSYDWQISQKYTSSTDQTITTNFPNVRVTLSDFQNLLGISNILKSSSLSSSYAATNKQTGVVDWEEPTSEEQSMNFSPLVSWQGNWENDITSRFNLNHSQSEIIQFNEQGDIIRNSTNQSATMDLSWSFSAEKGIKLPLMRERFYIKNEATLSMNATYSRNWGTRIGYDNVTQKDDDQMNFSVRPQISYDFSKSITAGLTSEYKINNNNKTNNKLTTFSLSMWVEIIF